MSPSSSFGAEFQEQTPVAYFDISSSSEEETSPTGARELHGAEGRALVDQRRIVAKTTSPRNSNQKSSKRARFGSHCALTARSLTSAQLQSASAALAHHDEHAIVRSVSAAEATETHLDVSTRPAIKVKGVLCLCEFGSAKDIHLAIVDAHERCVSWSLALKSDFSYIEHAKKIHTLILGKEDSKKKRDTTSRHLVILDFSDEVDAAHFSAATRALAGKKVEFHPFKPEIRNTEVSKPLVRKKRSALRLSQGFEPAKFQAAEMKFAELSKASQPTALSTEFNSSPRSREARKSLDPSVASRGSLVPRLALDTLSSSSAPTESKMRTLSEQPTSKSEQSSLVVSTSRESVLGRAARVLRKSVSKLGIRNDSIQSAGN